MMARTRSFFTLSVLTLAILFIIAPVEAATVARPANPFADAKNDPYNPLRYIASNVLTAIAFSLFLCVAFLQTWRIFKHGAKWMLATVVGLYAFAFGLSIRFVLHTQPESRWVYILEDMFVVLSPCLFIAADYVLLGRLAKHLHSDDFLLIPARRITWVFVASDISTFLIQAGGGSITASAANSPSLQKTGSHIFLGALALQLLSFLCFTFIYMVFLYRIYTHRPDIWNRDQPKRSWYNDWRTLAAVLFISCIGILIRSCYRVAELSQGFEGPLATSETLFYGLDTLPLFIATVVYVPFWPGRFIQSSETIMEGSQAGAVEMSSSMDTVGYK